MALSDNDKSEIKRLMTEVLVSDNPGVLDKLVPRDLCDAKHKGVGTWMVVITGLLGMTLSAAGWAAMRATEAAASVGNIRQMVSTLLQQIGMVGR